MTLSVEDRLDIEMLYSEYGHRIDFHDPVGWSELFTRDGLWQLFVAGSGEPLVEVRGRVAIAEMARADNQERAGSTRHWAGNVVVESNGSAVAGRCYSLVLDLSGDGVKVESYADVEDELAKVDGAWLFSRRVVRLPRT